MPPVPVWITSHNGIFRFEVKGRTGGAPHFEGVGLKTMGLRPWVLDRGS
jgi:hypothetical protein